MLIVTADDFGQCSRTTDCIMACSHDGRVTTASAMVFMRDSHRAADIALSAGLETGLHVNLTLPFDGDGVSANLREAHGRIVRFLHRSRRQLLLLNPFLMGDFDLAFRAQCDEYGRLYGREPALINGHHHMHLCTNMILGRTIPRGRLVRRSFTFFPTEKGLANRLYRRAVDAWLLRRFASTDFFFSIEPVSDLRRLAAIVALSQTARVELMVHPAVPSQKSFLESEEFLRMTEHATLRPYSAVGAPVGQK